MFSSSAPSSKTLGIQSYFENYWDCAAVRLMRAVTDDDREEFETLLSQGTPFNIQIEGDTVLTRAINLGRYRMTKQLLQKGAELQVRDGWGRMPLMLAARYGEPKIMKLLLYYGADVKGTTVRKRTALIDAAEGGHLTCVQVLLHHGADINAQEEGWFVNGDTALMKAAYDGFTGVVALLLKNGADISIEAQFNGVTAMNLAAKKGRLSIIKLLAARGGDPERPDGTGKTPLMEAAENGHLEVVRFLLNRSEQINLQDRLFKRTALGWAVHNDHEKIARRLLVRGADPWIEDINGENVIKVAEKHGMEELARALLKKGEQIRRKRK